MTLALQATGITKRFPSVLANDHVNFSLERGEIHALLGENGARKSTLTNMLIALIGVTDVVNILDTNIQMRRREIAILKSVGLTPGGFLYLWGQLLHLIAILFVVQVKSS